MLTRQRPVERFAAVVGRPTTGDSALVNGLLLESQGGSVSSSFLATFDVSRSLALQPCQADGWLDQSFKAPRKVILLKCLLRGLFCPLSGF